MGPKMTLHFLQFLNKNILLSGKITKIRGSWAGGGDAMTHTLWNGNSREVGGLRQKCSPLGGGGYEYFLKLHNFNSIRGSQNLWGRPVCKLSISSGEQRSVRERARPSLSFCVLLAFAFHDISLREFAHRLWQAMGWTSEYVLQQGHFSISYLEVNHMYYKHMWCYLIIWTLPPSSDHKPAKKGFHCHLKVSQHFRGRKTLLIYLKQSLLLLFEM